MPLPAVRFDRLLDRGPGAEVWAATLGTGPPTRVVIKRLRSAAGAPSPAEVVLVAEQAARLVRHPHLLGVLGVLDEPDGPALVLPHVAGGSLADLLAIGGVLPPGEVVAVLGPVADALDALHEAGLVHGDVSPGNILLTAAGQPLLADLAGPSGRWATPAYVAPEVAAGGPAGPAADVHALAATAYEALAGRVPHPGDADDALAAARAGHHRPLRERPGVSPLVAAAVECGLAADQAQRPPSAGALLRALADVVDPCDVRLPGPATGTTDRLADLPSGRRRTARIAAGGWTVTPVASSPARRRAPLAWPPWPTRRRSPTKRCP